MGAMAGGHVCRVGDVPAPAVLAHVARDALGATEDLYGARRRPQVEALAHESVGHGVVAPVRPLDVVVDVGGDLLPLGEAVGGLRQRCHHVALELVEQLPTARRLAPERSSVHELELGPDRLVRLGEAEKAPVPKRRQHPALADEHARLDGRLVAGPGSARRQHDGAVVLGELGVGPVELGVVEAGLRDGRFQVVGHRDLAHAAVVRPHVLVRPEPRPEILAPGRLGVQEPGTAEHPDEDLRPRGLARAWVDDLHRVAREVDEAPLAGPVAEAHHDVLAGEPGLVVVAELAVAVAVGVLLFPLDPDEPERDVAVATLQLPVHLPPVGDGPARCERRRGRRVEQLLEPLVVEVVRQRPPEAAGLGSCQHLVDGRLAGPGARGDLPVGEPCGLEPQGFSDLSHG